MAADERLDGFRRDIASSLAFLTVLPLGNGAAPDFRVASRAFPLVGALIGAAGGLVILLAAALGLPPLAVSLLGVGATIGLTGALHEDGLADTLDSLGGAGRAERLEIMRDSRIGTYGVLGLIASVALRTVLLADWLPASPWQAALALVAMESVGRGAVVWLWASLPAARADGLAATLGAPDNDTRNMALVFATLIAVVAGFLAAGVMAILVALAAAALATATLAPWSRRHIGGRTGDILGAGEQAAALAFLLTLAAFS